MYIDRYKKQEVMSKRILYTVQDIIKDGRKLLSLALCPLGIFVYMTFLKHFCGDAWAFYHVQRAWRTQKLFPVIGVLYKSCTGQLGSMSDVKQINGIILGWFCVFALLLYVIMIARKHYSAGAFGIVALIIPLTSSVMSTLRFIVGSFVIYIGITQILLSVRVRSRRIIMVLLAVAEVVCISAWYFWDGLLM